MKSSSFCIVSPFGRVFVEWLEPPLDELRNLLEPYYHVCDEHHSFGADIVLCIEHRSLNAEITSLSGKITDVQGHLGKEVKVQNTSDSSYVAVFRDCAIHAKTDQAVDEYRLEFRGDKNELVIEAVRLIRAILIGRQQALGQTPLHMSALSIGGKGVCFTGPSGGGKTSFLTASLLAFPDAELVSNDKVLLDHLTGKLHGLPFAVTIGLDTLKSVPEIVLSDADRIQGGEALIWPNNYCRSIGRDTRDHTYPSVLFLVNVDFGAAGIQIGPASPAEIEETWSALRDYRDSVSMTWAVEALHGTSTKSTQNPESCSLPPIFTLRGNPFHEHSKYMLRDLILELLEREALP